MQRSADSGHADAVYKLLEGMGLAPLRLTDRHWRLGQCQPMVDLEWDGELKALTMTCGRLCLVPVAFVDVVHDFCLHHVLAEASASYVLEGNEVFCILRLDAAQTAALSEQTLGIALNALLQDSRAFIDRLMCRYLEDLVFRIPHLSEKAHESHLPPGQS